MRLSLSARVALGVAVLVPVLVLLSGVLLLGLVNRDLHAAQNVRLRERAATALPNARRLLVAVDNGQVRVQANQQRMLTASALDVGLRLVSADGTEVLQAGPQPGAAAALPATLGKPQQLTSGGTAWQVLGTRVTGTAAAPGGTLWLFSPLSTVTREVGTLRRRILLVALVAAPVGGAVSLLVTRGAVRPLRRLQRATSGMDPRLGEARLDHEATHVTEVDDLAHTLQTVLTRYDEQAARTAEALATARAFSASASHELRTPLMSMGTNLEILAEHPDLSPADRAEVLADLRAEHARLQDLLAALRALAQGDLVEQDAFGPVDLAELVEASVREARTPVAFRTQPGDWRIHGWEPGLRMAVDNLLTNALVHGQGKNVQVELRREGGVAVLTVDDAGPGIPPDQREAVFRRFHRRPDSPGSGLGLTLVAQQIALHRGTVTAQDGPGGTGTRMEVRLPLRGPEAPTVPLPSGRRWL